MQTKILIAVLSAASLSMASNMANPAAAIPEARVSIGASYHLGGYTLTNEEIPSIFNRLHARVHYAPSSLLGFGIDLGTTQVDVDKTGSGSESIPLFHGKFGFSGGAHLRISSPFFLKEHVSFLGIGQATYFSSENKHGASYNGFDGSGVIGVQFHIPGFGYISVGPLLYLIQGSNKHYTGETDFYSNTNNLRGWISIDFFPRMKELFSNKAYVSLEFSASPLINASSRIPVQEFSVSLSIGSVTGRLYGTQSDLDWEP